MRALDERSLTIHTNYTGMATTSVGLWRGSRRAATPIFPQRVPRGSRGLVHIRIKGTGSGRRGVSQLSTRCFSAREANVASRGGLLALLALLAHHFFGCSATGKPLHAPAPVFSYSDDELKRPGGGLIALIALFAHHFLAVRERESL